MTSWSQSGWYTATLLQSLTGVTQSGNPTLVNLVGSSGSVSTYMYLSLLSSAPTAYTTPVAYDDASAAWVNTDEVTGTNWSTGGVELYTAYAGSDVVPTLTQTGSQPYSLTYSWTNPLSVSSTTISTAIYGCIIYYHGISAPVSKPCLLALYFGTGYTTVSGTFGITPSGSGLSVLTLTG